jgi:DNA-binding CsgD family transcriptional regulator
LTALAGFDCLYQNGLDHTIRVSNCVGLVRCFVKIAGWSANKHPIGYGIVVFFVLCEYFTQAVRSKRNCNMSDEKSVCLKRFGFLPKAASLQEKPAGVGRRKSQRFYVKDIKGVYLTTREVEVMRHLADGCTVRKAAESMQLSPRTVEFYVQNVRHKLAARNKKELLQILFQHDFFEHLD